MKLPYKMWTLFGGLTLSLALIGGCNQEETADTPPPSAPGEGAVPNPTKGADEKKDEAKADEKKAEEKKDEAKADEKKAEEKKDEAKADEKKAEEKKDEAK